MQRSIAYYRKPYCAQKGIELAAREAGLPIPKNTLEYLTGSFVEEARD